MAALALPLERAAGLHQQRLKLAIECLAHASRRKDHLPVRVQEYTNRGRFGAAPILWTGMDNGENVEQFRDGERNTLHQPFHRLAFGHQLGQVSACSGPDPAFSILFREDANGGLRRIHDVPSRPATPCLILP